MTRPSAVQGIAESMRRENQAVGVLGTSNRRRWLRRAMASASVAGATLALGAAPAFAHDCFNPTKVPTAGVNYELSFDSNGNPIVTQIGPGQGYGGFVAIAPYTFGPTQTMTLYTHSLGAGNNPHGVVGGPGSQTLDHACNGTGIDYLSACYGGG